MDNEELFFMIADCMSRKNKMTEFENNFFQAISDKIAMHLTAYQKEKIVKIWEQVTTRQTGARRP